jgi:hypothetical protein
VPGSNLRVVQIRTDSKRWRPQDICPKKIFVLRKRWLGCKLSGGEGRLVEAVNDAGHSGSGGRAFSLESEIELPVVARHIGRELRTQYILGYRPDQMPRDGKWHKIQVKLRLPKKLAVLRARAKTGYYAPAE